MEDATAVLGATECATSYASTGADQYVSQSSDGLSEAQAAQNERATPPKAKRARRGEAVSRRTAVHTDQLTTPIAGAPGGSTQDEGVVTRSVESNHAGTPEADTNSAAASNSDEIRNVEPAAATSDAGSTGPASESPPTAERIIEALLFASDAPLSPGRIADLVGGLTPAIVLDCIDLLNADYAAAGRAFRITGIAGGFQMLTTPVFQPWLAKLDKHRGQNRLGDAALEVLSIIAYKQPIIRAEVEAIRGVACVEVMNRLRDMGLIKAVGRAEVVGRPLLYGTTRKFLDAFGLDKLEDLPPLEAMQLKSNPSRSE